MNLQQNQWTDPQRQSPAALMLILFRVIRNMIKTFWPLLIIYFVRGSRSFDSWELILILLPLFLFVRSFLEFLFFRFNISDEQLIIRTGILRKQTVAIPLNRIQAVHLEQTFIHSLLGASRISFDSTGSEKVEVKIDALKTSNANELKDFILSLSDTTVYTANTPFGKNPGYTDNTLFGEYPESPGNDAFAGNATGIEGGKVAERPKEKALITLGLSDLLKLSFSSNHIEAFFIILSFLFSILDNLRELIKDKIELWADEASAYLVAGSATGIIFLIVVVLVVSVIVSTGRTFLTYFNFFISKTATSYKIKSGFLNIREKLVPFNKIQFISWRANFVRRKLGIYLLQFHSVGNDEVKDKQQIKIPLTQTSFIPLLCNEYQPLFEDGSLHMMNAAYARRRLLIIGIPLTAVLTVVGYFMMEWKSLYLLLILPYVYISARTFSRRFRLKLSEEALFIHKGVWGTQEQLLRWNKIQKISIRQSRYQQKNNLANLYLHTAGGVLSAPFLELDLAQRIMDYALYKIEAENEPWI
ncbi:MAG TPA: PH domain-containing protein [Parasegetibacter sp.]